MSSLTFAELAVGPHATNDPDERARRQDRLQRTEAAFEPLPFDGDAARAYGRICARVLALGRQPRSRAVDLMVAAVACASGLPVVTRNPDDLEGLEGLVEVIPV